MTIRTLLKRGGITLAAASLLATPTTLTAAQATPAPAALAGAQAGAVCATDEHDTHAHARVANGQQGRGRDHARVSDSLRRQVNEQLRAVQRTLRAEAAGAPAARSTSSSRLPDRVVIDVHVHNIYGAHKGERDIGIPRLQQAVTTLSEHFAGWDEPNSLGTRFRFRMVSAHTVRSDAFYHAEADSPTDRRWKRKLHRGGSRALNLYIAEHRSGGEELLGWARFPWQYAGAPALDGVTVHPETLPGRQMLPYDQGDTVTHEVGHWLGLFHVFEGNCANRDGVDDTHAQHALFECINRDSCGLLAAGSDQPFNYMQYTPDRCMQTFTQGQSWRMDAAWAKWRA